MIKWQPKRLLEDLRDHRLQGNPSFSGLSRMMKYKEVMWEQCRIPHFYMHKAKKKKKNIAQITVSQKRRSLGNTIKLSNKGVKNVAFCK